MSDLPFTLSPETPDDEEAILRLNERVFGPGRFARTAYRVREKTPHDLRLSFVARVGPLLVGANAMTPILHRRDAALLLGPLIVEPVFRSRGIGEALVNASLEAARAAAGGWRSWSATSPITAAWVSSRRRRAAFSFPGPSTRRGCCTSSWRRGRWRG